MSDLFRTILLSPDGEGSGPTGADAPSPNLVVPQSRRAGSVRLRQNTEGVSDADLLDPANQSLADALRLLYKFVIIGVIALFGVYLWSGFGSVKEGSRGIRLLFGKVQESNLDPGFRFSVPQPFGELVTVEQGRNDLSIDKSFWVFIPDGQDPQLDKINPTASLKPDQGGTGSVLTGDGNIAHTKWQVGYRRDDVTSHAQNLLPAAEEALVRAAVMRGVVHACAGVTITQLLQQTGDQLNAVSVNAKAVAQKTLDNAGSGIKIDSLNLSEVTPPLFVRGDFNKVASASSAAAAAIEKARTEANEQLNKVAGEAAPYIIQAIDDYEVAVARGEGAGAEKKLQLIDDLMMGKEVEVDEIRDGRKTGAKIAIKGRVSGEVATVISAAERSRNETISMSKSDLLRFQAKLAQYNSNPSVMVQREWASALSEFYNSRTVELMMVPPGTSTIALLLNRDPAIARELDSEIKRRELEDANRQRELELRREGVKTQTGLTETPS